MVVLEAALTHVGYQRVRVDLQNNTVDLPAGMRIGLGGIAKGYGVDRATAALMRHGVKHGIVNAGGDMKVLGERFGARWEIALPKPNEPSTPWPSERWRSSWRTRRFLH